MQTICQVLMGHYKTGAKQVRFFSRQCRRMQLCEETRTGNEMREFFELGFYPRRLIKWAAQRSSIGR